MDEDQLSQEEALKVWNEEAAKLDAGDDNAPADSQAAAPDDLSQDLPQDQPNQTDPQDALPGDQDPAQQQGQAVSPQPQLPPEVMAALAEINQLKQANAQLLHHVKTAEGRVAAMQREFQQARAAQQSVAPNDAPTQGQMAAAAKNPEKWEQLKQDFPEWASAMEEYVGSKLSGIQPTQPLVQPEQVIDYVQRQLAGERAQMRKAIEEARIEGRYENWRDLINTTEFAQWFTVQPADVRALADSPMAKDAIRMLDLFQQAKAKPASDIRQERSQRLAAAATTRPGQTPPPKTMDDMSPEELWNYEAAKREKTRAQRGY